MSNDNSPAAFPLGANEYGGHGSQAGMTLRDYFAAKAMQAWLSTYGDNDRHPAIANNCAHVAEQAYQVADAMFTTFRERRNRRAFGNAQLAYDMASDPLWDEPDPEPDDEPEEASDDQQNREGLEVDPGRD